MSARRCSRHGGFYPDLCERDVLRDGHLLAIRFRANRPFGDRQDVRVDVPWSSLDDIPGALKALRDEEARATAHCPPAWDPEFGYLSPDPTSCGNGLFVSCLVHLEALSILGDIKYVLAGLSAARIDAWGFSVEPIADAAHVYSLENRSSFGLAEDALVQRVTAVYRHLVTQELNARRHLVESDKRVFSDAIARAIALLRAARMLSPWETTDMLSPLRVAASMGFIDGITAEEIDDFTLAQFKKPPDDPDTQDALDARDRRDASFADHINRRFAKVRLNRRGQELLES